MALRSRLPRIAAELAPVLDGALRAGAQLIAERAKERVPVDTGKLRDAIHVEHEGPGEYAVVAGGKGVFYGHIVEHGGVNHSPHPFLTPAVEDSRREIEAFVAMALRNL